MGGLGPLGLEAFDVVSGQGVTALHHRLEWLVQVVTVYAHTYAMRERALDFLVHDALLLL